MKIFLTLEVLIKIVSWELKLRYQILSGSCHNDKYSHLIGSRCLPSHRILTQHHRTGRWTTHYHRIFALLSYRIKPSHSKSGRARKIQHQPGSPDRTCCCGEMTQNEGKLWRRRPANQGQDIAHHAAATPPVLEIFFSTYLCRLPCKTRGQPKWRFLDFLGGSSVDRGARHLLLLVASHFGVRKELFFIK